MLIVLLISPFVITIVSTIILVFQFTGARIYGTSFYGFSGIIAMLIGYLPFSINRISIAYFNAPWSLYFMQCTITFLLNFSILLLIHGYIVHSLLIFIPIIMLAYYIHKTMVTTILKESSIKITFYLSIIASFILTSILFPINTNVSGIVRINITAHYVGYIFGIIIGFTHNYIALKRILKIMIIE